MADVVTELGTFGEAAPLIGVRFAAVDGASEAARKVQGSFLAEISKNTALQAGAEALAAAIGVPTEAVTLMHEGHTLDLSKSLQEIDEITIPGARARREGEKVQLGFDTQYLVMASVEEEKRKQQEAKEREEKRLAEAKRKAEEQEKRDKQEAEKQRLVEERKANATNDLLNQISDRVGVEKEQFDRLQANPDPDVKKPKHYLTRATLEQEQALGSLLAGAGGRDGVVAAFEIHNEDLLSRYNRAKQGLRDTKIQGHEGSTTKKVQERKDLAFLGPFDGDVNELCLWHGTTKLEGAGGICANGFDISYVGSAVGTAWGHGFYFADNAGTSLGYTGGGVLINPSYTVRIMFLCRVLCGRVRELTSAPSQEQKEALTAQCLGPGGVFGSKSEVHSIHGGKWCYVCAHNHQVYPQYVIFMR
mmetsp:Transcript_110408/g.154960  ORF Transcript_110408/g.154960 Transcript_110408/m.154960 type:complete len:418 (+) Transcript_110408:61-1314(+)